MTQENLATLVLNDTHIGVVRGGGTTPMSRLNLQSWLRQQLEDTLKEHLDHHVVFNGDLLDKFDIAHGELIHVYRILSNWAVSSHEGAKMWVLAGNHDISAKGDKVSSFALLCEMLTSRFPGKVNACLMEGLVHIHSDIWAIPHCANQDLFDLELERAMETSGISKLLLHANYDNNFAAQADHSLNVSADMAKCLSGAGIQMIFGHEHQFRMPSADIVIVGNQWATSVADCLGNDDKKCIVINEDGSLTWKVTQDIATDFVRVDWKELTLDIGAKYVRVEGDCTAESAQDMITAVAKFRAKSAAFVVTNAVKVDGVEGLDDFEAVSFENIKAFDVYGELRAMLTPAEAKVTDFLMEVDGEPATS